MGSQRSDINGFIFLSDYFEDLQLQCPASSALKTLRNNFDPSPIRITILSRKKIIQPPPVILEYFFNLQYYISTLKEHTA